LSTVIFRGGIEKRKKDIINRSYPFHIFMVRALNSLIFFKSEVKSRAEREQDSNPPTADFTSAQPAAYGFEEQESVSSKMM